MQTAAVWSYLPFLRSGQNHLARHSDKGEEDKADRGRGGKTTSGNGQAWSSPSEKWRKLVAKLSVVPNDPRGEGIDDGDDDEDDLPALTK